jgi:C-terminal processing protease CtpA/Prc
MKQQYQTLLGVIPYHSSSTSVTGQWALWPGRPKLVQELPEIIGTMIESPIPPFVMMGKKKFEKNLLERPNRKKYVYKKKPKTLHKIGVIRLSTFKANDTNHNGPIRVMCCASKACPIA